MIKGIAHVAYTVMDMEKSLAFYCDALGFKKAFELSNAKGEPWIVYIKVKDGQFIELFYGQEGQTPHASPIGYSHLCLEVDDIDEIANQMTEKGIPITSGPSRGKDGNAQCWVADPDGNRIEFMQMAPDSLQSRS